MYLPQGLESSVRQRLYVVVVEREQAETRQVAERVPTNARDLVRVEQQQLQCGESLEDASWKILDFVAVQHERIERLEAGKGVVSDARDVVVRQIDSSQSTVIGESLRWNFGDVILLHATVGLCDGLVERREKLFPLNCSSLC